MKPAKILFFVNGNAPSPEDFREAADLNATVVFRNATAVPADANPDALEECDGVAGAVPEVYSDRYPDAKEAIANKKKELKVLADKVGDSMSPKALKKLNDSEKNAHTVAAVQATQADTPKQVAMAQVNATPSPAPDAAAEPVQPVKNSHTAKVPEWTPNKK